MQIMNTGRELFDPFAPAKPETAVASSSSEEITDTRQVATASALTNMNPSQCPKCGSQMGNGILADGGKVYYCPPCRVTNPIPV